MDRVTWTVEHWLTIDAKLLDGIMPPADRPFALIRRRGAQAAIWSWYKSEQGARRAIPYWERKERGNPR